MTALDEKRFPDHCRQSKPAEVEAALMAHPAVLEFLDALGERRPIRIIGNSLGGAVAMQLAMAEQTVPPGKEEPFKPGES